MTSTRTVALSLACSLTIVGAISGPVRASTATAGDAAAIQAVMVRDMTIAVAPWIPCIQGSARALSLRTVRARQRVVDTLIAQTYAPSEPTHGGLRTRLRALIASYGPEGAATRAGETLCDVGGGIDRVQVRASTLGQGRARMTIQAHEWNETIGRYNGVAFHYRPQAIIAQTDDAVLEHGRWLISRRGPVTFMTGAP